MELLVYIFTLLSKMDISTENVCEIGANKYLRNDVVEMKSFIQLSTYLENKDIDDIEEIAYWVVKEVFRIHSHHIVHRNITKYNTYISQSEKRCLITDYKSCIFLDPFQGSNGHIDILAVYKIFSPYLDLKTMKSGCNSFEAVNSFDIDLVYPSIIQTMLEENSNYKHPQESKMKKLVSDDIRQSVIDTILEIFSEIPPINEKGEKINEVIFFGLHLYDTFVTWSENIKEKETHILIGIACLSFSYMFHRIYNRDYFVSIVDKKKLGLAQKSVISALDGYIMVPPIHTYIRLLSNLNKCDVEKSGLNLLNTCSDMHMYAFNSFQIAKACVALECNSRPDPDTLEAYDFVRRRLDKLRRFSQNYEEFP